MFYIDKTDELTKQMEEATEEFEILGNKLDAWKGKGFFYRLTHRSERRDLNRMIDAVVHDMDEISKEQLDLSRLIDIQQENQMNAQEEIRGEVLSQIKQYAKENGLYMAKDFEVVNLSNIYGPEDNPKFSDYEWGIKHGDGHVEYFDAESVQDLIDKADEYGDILPVTEEKQWQLVREIESKIGLFPEDHVSLQNSDVGVQVVISSNDELNNVSRLSNKKIPLDELSKRIELDGEMNTDPDRKISLFLSIELEIQTKKNVEATKEYFAKEGMYLSNDIDVMPSDPNWHEITLFSEGNSYVYEENSFTDIPTKDEIINFAKKNKILTKISPEEQRNLENKFDKMDFEVDDVIHSYKTYVSDLKENENGPTYFVFNDDGMPFESLQYNAKEDCWIGDKYGFKIDNPVPSIKDKYQNLALEITRSDYEKQVHHELKEIAQKMGKAVLEKKLPTVEIAPYVHKVEDLDIKSDTRFLVQNEIDGKMEILHSKSVNELFEQMDEIGLVDRFDSKKEKEEIQETQSEIESDPELEM